MIVCTTCRHSPAEVHSLYALPIYVFTTNLCFIHCSLLSANDSPFFQTHLTNFLSVHRFLKGLFSIFSVRQSSALSFAAYITTSTFSGGRRNVSCSLLTEFVDIFLSAESSEKFHMSSLNMRESLRWIVREDSAFLQKVVVVLKVKTKSQRLQNRPLSLHLRTALFCAKRALKRFPKF